MDNFCRICGRKIKKYNSRACGGDCSRKYYKMKEYLTDGFIHRNFIKEVNRGFCWDETSVLI